MEHLTETDIALISMIGSFLVAFAIFIWWIATKFFGLKMLLDNGFLDIKEKMAAMHLQNVERFHGIETRLLLLERKPANDVQITKG